MKTLFLLPPSEGKTDLWEYNQEKLSFNFEKPCEIAVNATEKDLKCTWKRYKEAINLNKSLCLSSPQPSPWGERDFLEAIKRYSWVMFNAINYSHMSQKWQKFFEENFLIFSGMYGIVKPLDKIGNYKLPIEKADHYKFWWDKIPQAIIDLEPDYIVNLLPINYAKMIWLLTNCSRHKKKLEKILDTWIKVININFLKLDWKKVSHWVKKIKWEWIKNICEKNIVDYKDFWWEIVDNKNGIIDVNITQK